MRGAFVVQVWKATQGSQLEGLVEEVDTLIAAKFHSETELIEFLLRHFRLRQQSQIHEEGTNGPTDNR